MTAPALSTSWEEFMPEYPAACQVNADSRALYFNFLKNFASRIGPVKAQGMMHAITHAHCQSFYDSLLASGLIAKCIDDL